MSSRPKRSTVWAVIRSAAAWIARVGDDRHRIRAGLADPGERGLECFGGPARDRDGRTGAGEGDREGRSDGAATTDHEGDLTLESEDRELLYHVRAERGRGVIIDYR